MSGGVKMDAAVRKTNLKVLRLLCLTLFLIPATVGQKSMSYDNCGEDLQLDQEEVPVMLFGHYKNAHMPRLCEYTVRATKGYWIEFQVRQLDLHGPGALPDCSNGTIQFFIGNGNSNKPEQSLCGKVNEPKEILIESKDVYVKILMEQRLQADFELKARMAPASCGLRNRFISSRTLYLFSPNYPQLDHHSQCDWVISSSEQGYTLQVDVKSIYVEDCAVSYLEFFDGITEFDPFLQRICSVRSTLTTRSSSVFIRFMGTGSFQLTITRVWPKGRSTTSRSSEDSDNTGLIIGCVLGSITVLIVVVTLCIFFVENKRRGSSSATRRLSCMNADCVTVRATKAEPESPSVFIVSPVIINSSGAPSPPYPGQMAASEDLPSYPATEFATTAPRGPPPRYNRYESVEPEVTETEQPPPYTHLLANEEASDRYSCDNNTDRSTTDPPVAECEHPPDTHRQYDDVARLFPEDD